MMPTKEIKGWSEVGTQLNGWKNAVVAEGVIPVNLFPQVMEPIQFEE